jgi:hypothetical protein
LKTVSTTACVEKLKLDPNLRSKVKNAVVQTAFFCGI